MSTDSVPVLSFATTGPGLNSMRQAHVNHGLFWPDAGVDLGHFCWDAWVTASVVGTLLTDGDGDAHSLRWGEFRGFEGESGLLSGSIWNGTQDVNFSGGESLRVGEWYHLAVAWDGANIHTYVNGIPDSVTPFAGPRVSAPRARGAGPLYVGLEWLGAIAFIRGWDRGVNPLGGGRQLRAFVPERFPGRYFNGVPCDFYCDYTSPGRVLLDSSPRGADAGMGRWFHHGRLASLLEGSFVDEEIPFSNSLLTDFGVPYWYSDRTCPFGRPLGTAGQVPGPRSPAPVPAGCLAFDSFGRADQTMATYVNTGLGKTEAGTLGPQDWRIGARKPHVVLNDFGLLGGAAVCLSPIACVAWVLLRTPAQDVRVSRSRIPSNPGETGLAFRVADADNYWSAYYVATLGTQSGPGEVHMVLTVGGSPNLVKKFPVASGDFEAIRVVASGSTITTYTGDGAANWTRVGELTAQTALQSASGAGLSNNRGDEHFSALMRFRNWTAFPA